MTAAPPVLFEMLRSFTTLASGLNLSQTANELGVTRQTVRRHIDALEAIRGRKLFEISDRQYALTPFGAQALTEAKTVLAKANSWLAGEAVTQDGLAHVAHNLDDGSSFHAQQHPLNAVWSFGVPLMQQGAQIWVSSQAQLEHRAMKKLRPYLVVYRKLRDDWLCVEIGEKSSYATWLGWTWAKSAIGSSLQDDAMHTPSDRFVIEAYNAVNQNGSIRYDHVHTQLPRKKGEALNPVSYQRLVLACLFPNGQPALATLLARTDRIKIEGLDTTRIPATPKANQMEFAI